MSGQNNNFDVEFVRELHHLKWKRLSEYATPLSFVVFLSITYFMCIRLTRFIVQRTLYTFVEKASTFHCARDSALVTIDASLLLRCPVPCH